ncbi:MAG: hypothetical protein A3K83_04930, partial [Omnitrophica WOR_2 bacterium RBG_13_44_8b]
MKILVIGSGGEAQISSGQLKEMAVGFGNLVKAVVDIEKGVMAVGGELHSDEEALLLEKGSRQRDLWGINLYPELQGDKFIEFDSLINLRPVQNNRSRRVEDAGIRQKI